MTSSVRSHSLLEQKKLQWAKEREEMLGLCGIWGSFARSYHDSDRSSIRSQYLSSIDLNHHVDTSPDASDASGEDRDSHSTSTMKFSLRRSPSLPPIFTPDKQSSCYGNEGDAEGEDETGDGEEGGTSGYASDSGGGNEYHVTQSWGGVLHRNSTSTNQWQPHNNFRRQTSPDSVTCGGSEMGRPRWGDKGVGVGHLWAPTTHNPDARLPQAPDPRPGPTPPAWLHRRLNKLGEPAQILVISHRDDASTRSKDFTGSCDSINSSECTKTTYLRGQNIPLEPEELAEREIKRRKALEHQNAIRQQLEERERKRKEEKEKRMQDERRAEERLKKQQEMERKRLDDEQRRQKEKEEKEERKAQAMREALESAERAAREDKIRERRRHAAERNANATSDLDESMRRVQLSEHEQLQHNDSSSCSGSEQQFLNPQQQNYKMDSDCEQKPQQYANQQTYANQQNQQYTIQQNQQFTNQQQYTNQKQTHQLNSNGGDAITVISDTRKLQNHVSDDERPIATIKAAAVVAPIAAPSSMAGNDNDQSEHESGEESSISTSIGIVLSPQEISANQLSVIPSPGRLLTPSKFRTRQRAVEKATQTFLNKSERNQKLAQRYRGQQHSVARLEDRPKWGVNRPEMQYIKQSDRDPYRLRRVVNTRLRARNTSQETSRSPSPGKHSVFNSSNHSEASLNKSITSNSPSITGVSVSRGTTTPRLQVIQKVGSIRKSSAGRPRYISVKGAVMHSNHVRQRMLNRVQLQPPKMNLDANNVVNHEKTEIVSVRDVLNQLTSLRQGLSQKQHEWDISRCQTPYSEVSSRS